MNTKLSKCCETCYRKKLEGTIAHGCINMNCLCHTVPINQCDGCQRGLIFMGGDHYVKGKIVMGCTKNRYITEESTEKKFECNGSNGKYHPNAGSHFKQGNGLCTQCGKDYFECLKGGTVQAKEEDWGNFGTNERKEIVDLLEKYCKNRSNGNRHTQNIIDFMFSIRQQAVKEERDSWINQKSNQHDERIRHEERERIINILEQMVGDQVTPTDSDKVIDQIIDLLKSKE